MKNFSEICRINGHYYGVRALAFSPCGQILASGKILNFHQVRMILQ